MTFTIHLPVTRLQGPERITAEAVLSDMEGTLVDSSAVVESMWDAFASRQGMSERLAEIMDYSPGRPCIDTVRHFLPDMPETERQAISQWFEGEEMERTRGRMREIPGAAAFIRSLLDAAAPLALVTSAPEKLMRLRMEEGGVPVPSTVVCDGDVARGKPAPDPYLRAAELLGVPIESCLVLEDASSGYTAAQSAGAQVLLVGNGAPEAARAPRVADLRDLSVTTDGRPAS